MPSCERFSAPITTVSPSRSTDLPKEALGFSSDGVSLAVNTAFWVAFSASQPPQPSSGSVKTYAEPTSTLLVPLSWFAPTMTVTPSTATAVPNRSSRAMS